MVQATSLLSVVLTSASAEIGWRPDNHRLLLAENADEASLTFTS